MNLTKKPLATAGQANPSWMSIVQQQVCSLSFGVVQIVVHNGRVVQIERTEKVRLDKPQTMEA
jgi:hypothetical protein